MVDDTSVIRKKPIGRSRYGEPFHRAYDRAIALDGKLTPRTLAMPGMSGRHYRTFINNLIGALPDARYLEVGSYAGSTACSAMGGDTLRIVCIDNWREFGGPKDLFAANTRERLSDAIDFRLIESDFRAVDFGALFRSDHQF